MNSSPIPPNTNDDSLASLISSLKISSEDVQHISDLAENTVRLKVIKDFLQTMNAHIIKDQETLNESKKELNNLRQKLWELEDKSCDLVWTFAKENDFWPILNKYPKKSLKSSRMIQMKKSAVVNKDLSEETLRRSGSTLQKDMEEWFNTRFDTPEAQAANVCSTNTISSCSLRKRLADLNCVESSPVGTTACLKKQPKLQMLEDEESNFSHDYFVSKLSSFSSTTESSSQKSQSSLRTRVSVTFNDPIKIQHINNKSSTAVYPKKLNIVEDKILTKDSQFNICNNTIQYTKAVQKRNASEIHNENISFYSTTSKMDQKENCKKFVVKKQSAISMKFVRQ